MNNKNALREVFANKEISASEVDFMHNKYCNIIPISPQLYSDDLISNGTLANLHMELDDSQRTMNHYKATVFYICM